MQVKVYPNVAEFLQETQAAFLQNEVENNLIFGLSLVLQNHPEIYASPFFATVSDEGELAVAALRTPPHNLILYAATDTYQPALQSLAKFLQAAGVNLPGVVAPSELAEAFANLWAEINNLGYRVGVYERIYELTQVVPPKPSGGFLRQATQEDLALVAQWLSEFHDEAISNDPIPDYAAMAQRYLTNNTMYFWEDEQPVSMLAQARPTLNGICIGPVYTPPQFRGKGYASNCVAELSQKLLDSGRKFCCLFTDLSNPTSNSIYQKVGYKPLRDFKLILFDKTSHQ